MRREGEEAARAAWELGGGDGFFTGAGGRDLLRGGRSGESLSLDVSKAYRAPECRQPETRDKPGEQTGLLTEPEIGRGARIMADL